LTWVSTGHPAPRSWTFKLKVLPDPSIQSLGARGRGAPHHLVHRTERGAGWPSFSWRNALLSASTCSGSRSGSSSPTSCLRWRLFRTGTRALSRTRSGTLRSLATSRLAGI